MEKQADDWPLSIHKSFWGDWAFVKWQALRRNRRYRRDIARLYKQNANLFETSPIAHLLREYRPPTDELSNYNPILCSTTARRSYRFSEWCFWARNESAARNLNRRMENEIVPFYDGMESELVPAYDASIEIPERGLSRKFTTKQFNCSPVRPDVCFPHPDFLNQMHSLPFAIPVQPLMRKRACRPYEVLVETGLTKPKYLALDISFSKDVIRREVLGYLNQLKTVVRARRQVINVKPVLRRIIAQIPRRKISLHADVIPCWFAVWDLRQQRIPFPKIAGRLWPQEYDPDDKLGFPGLPGDEKYPAVQRAQDYYDNAKSLIETLIMPSEKSAT